MVRPFKRMRMDEPVHNVSNKRRFECVSEANIIINNKCPRITDTAFFINLFPPKKAVKRKFKADIIENNHKFQRTENKYLSAIKIQKVFRGWCCRYRLRKVAVIKIQRICRGWIIRRKFHLRKFFFYN